jgi:uncharacterized repeat protein (TIGR01451 family)
MFKKIVSNLPFSPALVGQLGFYAKRLRKEEATRKLALIFVVLALIIQSLAIFQPTTSANAASLNDMVNGGLDKSINNFLSAYDSNTRNLKDTLNYIGITRNEITATKFTSFQVENKLSWGFTAHFSYNQGERQYNITNSFNQQVVTIYSRPLDLLYVSHTQIPGWVGYSRNIGWFAIMQASGDLVTNTSPSPSLISECSTNSQLANNKSILIGNSSCNSNIKKSETVVNISQGSVDASKVTANSGDQINYTITISNNSLINVSTVNLDDNISDILDYSSLIDNGGGTLNMTNKILSWANIVLNPGDVQSRTFIVRLLDSIPPTARGTSDTTSFDCMMTNTFGNSTNINVDCPTPKIIEKITNNLPKTGPFENIIFGGVILIITVYLFARTRQLEKEIRIIRKNTNTGTI